MEKEKLVKAIAKDLRKLADHIEMLGTTEEVETNEASKDEKEPTIPFEKVRKLLAEKSQAGYTDEVKELINKYGATKLSGISPEHYEEVVREAEVLGNG